MSRLFAYLISFDDLPDDEDELTGYDWRGDTEPLQPVTELICHWCERAYVDCTCMEGDE